MTTQDDAQGIIEKLLQPFKALPSFPALPSAQELYDQMMAKIEPELTSAQASLLEEKYKNQTPQEKEQREMRYKNAFAQFDQVIAEYFEEIHKAAQVHSHTAMRSLEVLEKEQDDERLAELESNFDTAA